MPDKPLRPYQRACGKAIQAGFDSGLNRLLYTMATGLGKTRVFSEVIKRRYDPTRPALVLAHREELLDQAARSVQNELPTARIQLEQGPNRAGRDAHIVVGSIQSLAREGSTRLQWLVDLQPSLIVYDEAHHVAADGAQNVLSRFGCYDRGTLLLGCTATAKRLDQKALVAPDGSATFQECVFSYGILEGIRDEFLCTVRGFRVKSNVDLSGVTTRGGDFAPGELAAAVDNAERTYAALLEWEKIASERQTIIFCASVEHAENAAEVWRQAGISAQAVHGTMDKDTRRERIKAFKAGEIQVLTNCQVLTEGFDHPPVSCIILLRPTQSWSLYVQMAGRGTRIADGKQDLIIIDVVDNTKRHKLCTTASLLDLPPTLDLQGNSVLAAKERLDELADRRGFLPPEWSPDNWSQLETALEEVNLLGEVGVRPEVSRTSRYNWLWTPTGYHLSLGTNEQKTRRQATITSDALGQWFLRLWEAAPPPRGQKLNWQGILLDGSLTSGGALSLGRDEFPRFAVADSKLVSVWPDAGRVANRFGKWRKEPATEGQIKMLRRFGIGEDVLEDLDKGKASAMIDRLMASGRPQRQDTGARRARA